MIKRECNNSNTYRRGTNWGKEIPPLWENPLQKYQKQRVLALAEETLAILQKNFDNQRLNQLKISVQEKSSLDFRFKECYLLWIDGIIASKNNQYQEAHKFLDQASNFKAVTSSEKRMLARIYGGLGSTYLVLSEYKTASVLLLSL